MDGICTTVDLDLDLGFWIWMDGFMGDLDWSTDTDGRIGLHY